MKKRHQRGRFIYSTQFHRMRFSPKAPSSALLNFSIRNFNEKKHNHRAEFYFAGYLQSTSLTIAFFPTFLHENNPDLNARLGGGGFRSQQNPSDFVLSAHT